MEEKIETQKGSKFSSRHKKIIIIAIIIYILQYFLFNAPANATFGYHFVSIIIPIVSYSAILIIISIPIAAIICKFRPRMERRTLTFSLFVWLFLVAAVFDFGVGVYKVILYYKIISILGV